MACCPEHAFDVWANRTALWWPREHSVSADPGLTVAFEPHVGGRIYERTPAGVEHDWGEVIAWEPPHRLRYLWHIYGDRGVATDVEIRFSGGPGLTTVTIVHTGWDRLGEAGLDLRQRNRQAWGRVVPHFERACLDASR